MWETQKGRNLHLIPAYFNTTLNIFPPFLYCFPSCQPVQLLPVFLKSLSIVQVYNLDSIWVFFSPPFLFTPFSHRSTYKTRDIYWNPPSTFAFSFSSVFLKFKCNGLWWPRKVAVGISSVKSGPLSLSSLSTFFQSQNRSTYGSKERYSVVCW